MALALAFVLLAVLAYGATMAIATIARANVLAEKTATTHITAMIFTILIGATLFSLVFRGLGGDDMVQRALGDLPGGAAGAILAVMAAMFLLGFVMDAFEIISSWWCRSWRRRSCACRASTWSGSAS